LACEPPLILGFDTSAAHCAAALLSGNAVLGRRDEAMNRGGGERLLPLLEELLAGAGRAWRELDALAVCTGPGGFTGVRVGVAAARGLALGLGVPAIGVTVFEALAAGRAGSVVASFADRQDSGHMQAFRDGMALGPVLPWSAEPPWPLAEATVVGSGAGALAERLGLRSAPGRDRADPADLARVAATRLGTPQPRPAPLYLRPPDAAPSAEPRARILDDA
jgi:tRNA threonylcarbamoyl adenosine modification protein YeaZ